MKPKLTAIALPLAAAFVATLSGCGNPSVVIPPPPVTSPATDDETPIDPPVDDEEPQPEPEPDTTAPVVPVVTFPSAFPYVSGDDELIVSGQCEAAATVLLSGADDQTIVCSEAGLFGFTIEKTSDETFSFSIEQKDAALNTSPSVSFDWIRDSVVPSTPVVTFPSSSPYYSVATTLTISGTCTTDYIVRISGGSRSDQTQNCVGGLFSFSVTENVEAIPVYSIVQRRISVTPESAAASFTWIRAGYSTVGLYHFNNASPLADSSLYASHHLADFGTAGSALGRFEASRAFTAPQSDYLSVPRTTLFETIRDTFTIEAFVKFSTLPANGRSQVILSQSGAAGNLGWVMSLRRQGNSYVIMFSGSLNGTSTTEVKSSACTVTSGTSAVFQHYAVTWNRGQVAFFCDGVARGTGTIGTAGNSRLFASSAPLRVGRAETMNTNVLYLDGWMDELRISQPVRYSGSFSAPTGEFVAD